MPFRERHGCRYLPFWTPCRKDATQNGHARFIRSYTQAGICSHPRAMRCWSIGSSRLFRPIRKFVYLRNTEVPVARVGSSCFFFPQNRVFPSHSRISQRRSPFLQIAASRYRIGNFRNLSRTSDDLLPAHRPFDTANALDRSMHSTSLRSIDTSDTLHRDM